MITVKNLVKEFGDISSDKRVRAVDDISFEIPDGKLFTLLGPSGCGKSTTLKMIAGLETPTKGEIALGNKLVFSKNKKVNIPTNKRPIGMVFQSYAIWPHMTVFENVSFPLKVSKSKNYKKSKIKEKTYEALDLVGLKHLSERGATDLSGGQQQRVALARALVREPEVLLLDEPLSNLDAKLREQMREEIRIIQQKLGITAIFVTHDQSEALAISDIIMIMNKGKILELGHPQDIYDRPKTAYGAGFIGVSNHFSGKTLDGQKIKITHGLVFCPNSQIASEKSVEVFIRPEHFHIDNIRKNDQEWEGKVTSAIFQGDVWDYSVDVNGQIVRIRTNNKKKRFQFGETVYVEPVYSEIVLIPSEGEEVQNHSASVEDSSSYASFSNYNAQI